MQLRTKILLIIFVTMAALIGCLQLILSSVLLEKFRQLERASLQKDVVRAQKALLDEVHQLAVKEPDWARWDDSYQFIQDLNPAFIESNLNGTTLSNLSLYDVLFFGGDGKFRFGLRDHLAEGSKPSGIDVELLDELARRPEISHVSGAGREGILVLPSGVLAFAAQQILTSEGEGPPRGTLVFVKLVDDALVAKVANQVELSVTLTRIDRLPEAERAGILSRQDPLEVEIVSPSLVRGVGTVRDAYEKESLVIRLSEPRDIYNQGKTTLDMLFLALVVAGLSVMVVIAVLVERTVISRLDKVATQVELIACAVDSSQRVTVSGNDELGVVASSINTMLHALNTSEQQLREAKEVAEHATEARALFVANISHEVRTPINGVLGMSQVLLQLPLEPDQRQYVEMIRSSSINLLSVVNDVLDFSKIDSGKLELEQIPFSLDQLVFETLQSISLRAHEKGLELICRPSCNLPRQLIGDPVRLRQVLLNLIGNAIKFTEEGQVEVILDCERLSQFGTRLHCVVRDTGIGIPEEKLTTVFEAFTQADGSTSRKFGGTGLGLTISREIVELMGGSIWAVRAPERGTEFHFTGVFGCEGEPEILPYDLLGQKILLVDDNSCFRQAIGETVAARGGVIEAFGALPPVIRFSDMGENDHLVIDAELLASANTADWKDLCRRLNGQVVLTLPTGRSDLLKEIRKSWSAALVLKPVLPSHLLDTVIQTHLAGVQAGSCDESAESATKLVRRLRILVADDVGVNRQILRLMLEPQGHKVYSAKNGLEVLEFLEDRGYCTAGGSADAPVDVILMDSQMPEMDGSEAVKNIREREREFGMRCGKVVRLPVIAVTADAMTGDRESLLDTGMDDYLAKPIFAEDLFRKLSLLFQGAPAGEAEKHGTADRSAAEGAGPILNMQDLNERLGGNPMIVREMLEVFLEEKAELESAVFSALRARDLEQIRVTAHALRGSLANISAAHAWSVVDAIEGAARSGGLSNFEGEAERLESAIAALDAAIAEVLRAPAGGGHTLESGGAPN